MVLGILYFASWHERPAKKSHCSGRSLFPTMRSESRISRNRTWTRTLASGDRHSNSEWPSHAMKDCKHCAKQVFWWGFFLGVWKRKRKAYPVSRRQTHVNFRYSADDKSITPYVWNIAFKFGDLVTANCHSHQQHQQISPLARKHATW